ncbi:MAG: cytochrome c maturation protein CcmE, partial [Gemmatimonadota bacterium]|nr:cytochrome c maturation protein CcmE [Gemmatimonadota bacterium]
AQRVSRDPSFYDTGIKMEAKVVPGSVKRNTASQTIDFVVTDGSHTYPVTYRGVAPDTFTDAQEIEVVVEGRLSRDGVFHATSLLAKCGSRYEAHYDENGKQA